MHRHIRFDFVVGIDLELVEGEVQLGAGLDRVFPSLHTLPNVCTSFFLAIRINPDDIGSKEIHRRVEIFA